MGTGYTKEDIFPKVVEFVQRRGREVSNKEIDAFIIGRFGIEFTNLSEVIAGIREYDNRIVKTRRGIQSLLTSKGFRGTTKDSNF